MSLKIIYILAFSLCITSCTGVNVVYRDDGLRSNSQVCDMDVGSRMVSLEDEYVVKRDGIKAEGRFEFQKLECSHQRVMLSGMETAGLSDESASIYNTYDLNFLEFGGSDGTLMNQSQMDGLMEQIRADKDTYLIAFVHGWRHNADIANNDVRKFKTLLAYSRQFLNQRVRENGRYRNHRLIGLFLGWRGQVFDEAEKASGKDPSVLQTAGSVVTIPISEKNSLKVSPNVYDALKQISDALNLGDGASHDKFLIYGHSFGGNVLSTALSDCSRSTVDSPRCYQDAVAAHPPGMPMRSLLGDLVVMINPAASAWKWTDIQREVDRRQAEGERIFPITQKPIYMAFTATADWGDKERWNTQEKKLRKLQPDNATRVLFPVFRAAQAQLVKEQRLTIGHLRPTSQENHFGSTHEFVTNNVDFGEKSANDNYKGTTPEAALQTKYTRCAANDGWLLKARLSKVSKSGHSWDSGDGTKDAGPALAFASRWPKVDFQFRSQQYFESRLPRVRGKLQNETFEYSPYFNIPFWNLRAFESVIANHGSYVNYPFWCAVNQIVLDDITKQ